MPDEQKTATIAPGDQILTLINTFTCPDVRQGELVAAIEKSIDDTFALVEGLISASVHASLDRTRVVNYMQWRSAEAFDKAELHPKVQEHLAQIMAIAESADPRLFHVSSVRA
jgi:type III secretory pathway lipoprotein EscJ